jgi:hypothetical protein
MTDLVSDGGTIGQVLKKLTDNNVTTTADYAWDNAPGAVYVQDAPPANAIANSLWWDSDSGDLFIRYQDMDSAQWVQINASGGGGITEAPIDGTGYVRQDAGWVAQSGAGGGVFTGPVSLYFDGINGFQFTPSATPTWAFSWNTATFSLNQTIGAVPVWTATHATRVVDFAVAPTVAGAPIVMASALDVANERIARLEERLARLEGRAP